MKNMKQRVLLALTLTMSIAVMAGCTKNELDDKAKEASSTVETSTKIEEIEVSITLVQEGTELSTKTLNIPTDTNLMTAIQDNFDIKEDGGMITSIEGVEQNSADGLFWTYTINDEMVNTGAKETMLNDGDKVVFTYAKF